MYKRLLFAGLLAITTLDTAILATAHEGATGIVLERMKDMSSMQRDMKSMAGMLKGGSFEQSQALAISQNIRNLAAQLHQQFPDTKQSRQKASRSLDTVWTNSAGFKSEVQAFEKLTAMFDAAVKNNDVDAVTSAFYAVGKGCSSCHEKYRRAGE